jgi:hypothetical protein
LWYPLVSHDWHFAFRPTDNTQDRLWHKCKIPQIGLDLRIFPLYKGGTAAGDTDMRVFLTKTKTVSVANYADASAAVRQHIDANYLGAGCGSRLRPFTGGKIISELGSELGRVSYNGRVWDTDGQEIVCVS